MQPRGDRPVIISFRLEHLLGWGITAFLCLVPVGMWAAAHPLSTIHGFPAIMLNLGRITGLIGMVMYALNLIYATRLRFLEYLFGGLNRVYIAHHMLGGLALAFLSLHPLFLALRFVKVSIQQAALLLLPNGLVPLSALFDKKNQYHGLVLEQWAIFFGIVAFWGMVVLLLVTFFIKIPYRIWLMTHRFLGVAFFFGGLHVLFITSDTSKNGPLKYYILGLTALGLLAYIYKTLAAKILIRRYKYKIQGVKVVGGNVTDVYLITDSKALNFSPGQFVFIRFLDAHKDGVTSEWHPFSISSGPKDPYLRVSVKGLGDYTNKLSNIKVGTNAEVEGAYGRFSYTKADSKNQIWVAGGIGVTPFLSMARSLPTDGSYKVDLYYSVKTASELIDWNNLKIIAGHHTDHLRVFPYVGDQTKGHLSADYIEKTSGGLAGKEIFICGPPPMMDAMRQQFKQKLVPGTSLHSEEFAMS
jgi:predicted ferric reductase